MRFTILVVDDEKNIREGLAESLGLDGYRVRTAADGAEGLRAVEAGDVDLVITDLRMPSLSGGELLEKVSGRYPGLPVIVLTAKVLSTTEQTELAQLAQCVMTKTSLRRDRLLAEIHRLRQTQLLP